MREICSKNVELRNCTCVLSYISLDLNGVRRPMYSINCNNLDLYHLPKSLPDNTTTFYAQHNKVSSFERKNCHTLRYFYLSNANFLKLTHKTFEKLKFAQKNSTLLQSLLCLQQAKFEFGHFTLWTSELLLNKEGPG